MSGTFLRSDSKRISRLGRNRKKLQTWRKPRGRHSKIRKGRVGYPSKPTIGHAKPRKTVNLIRGKLTMIVMNMRELEMADKSKGIIISRRIGAKKRLEMIKKAQERGLTLVNARENNK